ncbi:MULTISPECIES: NB-ARC domain-containing protein [unclassified Streptomyces]|uniref:NB-ARC domain-containing protein n=1 Tax=unclassified Streptomyces TaxID=2593676 RepID=UPI00278C515D|nr:MULTISPECIES: NB-ARC domain-containing protein [unclassified Streptomyces]
MSGTGSATASGGGIANTGVLHIGTLVQPGQSPPPPPPSPAEIPAWVVDRDEVEQAVAAVCSSGASPVGITTGLEGSGGFGKTTVAQMVCAAREVREHFRDRVYLVTVGRGVRDATSIAAKIGEVTRFVTGDTATFTDPDLAGAHLGRLLDQHPDRRTLLVLDDVWDEDQLAPFLIGGDRCVRLVTTRAPGILPPRATRIKVDQMTATQARTVLAWDVPPLGQETSSGLLRATGRWPLLLRLVNRVIALRVATGSDPGAAALSTLNHLREQGPAAVDDPHLVPDLDDPRQRRKLIRATLEAATGLLPPSGAQRFAELGVFADGAAAPVHLVVTLWQATAQYDELRSRRLCKTMNDLSLLTLDAAQGGELTLHDVIRDYLRAEAGPDSLTDLNGLLVDAIESELPEAPALVPSAPQPRRAWWELTDRYLLDHAVTHLLAAGRTERAEAVACDIRWVEARLRGQGPSAPWRDCFRVPTSTAARRAEDLARIAHLLAPIEPAEALTSVLHSRLEALPEWRDQIAARQRDQVSAPQHGPRRPTLRNVTSPPDLPSPALLRALPGKGPIAAVAISPDGTWLVAAGEGGALRIWDPKSGRKAVQFGWADDTGAVHRPNAVAISPDGSRLATVCHDGAVAIWDPDTGEALTAFPCGAEISDLAMSPDGSRLATACHDGTVRIWDPDTGEQTLPPLRHEGPVSVVEFAPDGTWLASAGADATVRLWDPATGRETARNTAHRAPVTALAIAPDGTWLATASHERTIHIWDPDTEDEIATLSDGEEWEKWALAPDGTWRATTSRGIVLIWDPRTGEQLAQLTDTDRVNDLAISSDGTWLATACHDGTVRIWDPDGRGKPAHLRDQASARTTGSPYVVAQSTVAIAPDDTWLASAGRDGTVRIWDPAARLDAARHSAATRARRVAALQSSATPEYDFPNPTRATAPDGTWFARAGRYGKVEICERGSGRTTLELEAFVDIVTAVAVAPDGTWLAAVSRDGSVVMWDLPGGQRTVLRETHWLELHNLAMAPDGTRFATVGYERVEVWSRSDAALIATLDDTEEVHEIALAPFGGFLAAVGGNSIRIWDVAARRIVTSMRTELPVSRCAWAPDGRRLAVHGELGSHLYEFDPGDTT